MTFLFQVMTQVDKYSIALRPCEPVRLLLRDQIVLQELNVPNESIMMHCKFG